MRSTLVRSPACPAWPTKRPRDPSGLLAGACLALALLGCSDGTRQPDASPPGPGAPAAVAPPVPTGAAAVLQGRLNAAEGEGALPADERGPLQALYQPGGWRPLWLDQAHRPGPSAAEAVRLLSGAAAEGLQPADYQAQELQAKVAAAQSAGLPGDAEAAALDLALSRSMLRYLRHLHAGRADPRRMGFRTPEKATDPNALAGPLRAALQRQRLGEAVDSLRPPLEQYRSLRAMLARYRSLAEQPAPAPLPPVGKDLRPGQPYAGVPALHQRLVLLGDLPADAPAPAAGALYEGPLVDAVKRFQARHGLPAEGVLGKSTLAALDVPLARRVRQIELALERMRWFPPLQAQRFVGINIPMFKLWAGGPQTLDGQPALDMDVIVGRALDTETPAMAEEMRYIVFSPYWNVPRSIVREELLPALRRNPGHLAAQEMELVQGPGDDARPVEVTPEHLALLEQGQLRVRQRPGPKNSLGPAKFIFPNDDAVYLHGTPVQQLFDRSRRDLSHGCVRVENPLALAQWALQDQPEWTRERIEAAMSAGQQARVELKQPIQVLLFYVTAMVSPRDGSIHFATDIYGHDKKLEQALYGSPA